MMQKRQTSSPGVLVLGIGAYAYSTMRILAEQGARPYAWLTRDYGHYPPTLAGEVFLPEIVPDPMQIVKAKRIDLVMPMSIDWILGDWAEGLMREDVPVFSPTGEGMRLERERDFARQLCIQYGIPFPKSMVARNRLEAREQIERDPRPYVIKNTLCSPKSPVHTIICESTEDTLSWLDRIDFAEGVFLQEFMGLREAGHFAVVSDGELHSLVTNQEYKRAFDGNMGIVAGAPMGGLIEEDTEDKYGLAETLLKPLLPWFREVGFHGPVQVTAIMRDDTWHVLEYNVRFGVTCGPMILRMLENPLEVLLHTARNQTVQPKFAAGKTCGCSLTLAGYGYPYTEVTGPKLPVSLTSEPDCDIWWNEVGRSTEGNLHMTGHRIADVIAFAEDIEAAIAAAYHNMRKLRCLGSYYRTDIGATLWPPGSA